jgi:hypothetical protein
MRHIGFSTGALARGDFRAALAMLAGKNADAVELSALRQDELAPLVNELERLDLGQFKYISFHAPSSMEAGFEATALQLLEQVTRRGWAIIVHPNAMHQPQEWARLGSSLCIENMDKRKPIGQTAGDPAEIFKGLPEATFCFDIGHARQVDPTMSEASSLLKVHSHRLRQLHVSEVNTQSRHDALSLESVLAFQKVAHLIPADVPVILESRVEEAEIDQEIENALKALSANNQFAFVGGLIEHA